jgi:hypothetical protein
MGTEARADAIPSWDAAVGTLILGVFPYLLSDMARHIALAFGG